LMAHNPFGARISPQLSSVRGFEEVENDGQVQFTTCSAQAGGSGRRMIELTTEYESIGIPKWIIDGVRPRIRVSAVLQRRSGSAEGPRVSATMAVWRLEGIAKDHTFQYKVYPSYGSITYYYLLINIHIQVDIDPSSTRHGHSAFGGSDGLRIVLNSNCDVIISNVEMHVELPDKIPSEFSKWFVESREFRKSPSHPTFSPFF
ncbi:hypothetical protein PMAYCL1PPCAC_16484, partial [Pristionchus mayeri]